MESDHIFRRINDKTTLCLSLPNTILAFRGCVEVEVLSGVVNIFGCKLDVKGRKTKVLSTSVECAYTIDVIEVEENQKCHKQNIRSGLRELVSSDFNFKDIVELSKNRCAYLFHEYEDLLTKAFVENFPRIFSIRESELAESVDENSIQFLNFIKPKQTSILMMSDEWVDTMKTFLDLNLIMESNLRVIVVGGKNVGKSTFVKYLINSLLNTSNGVYHMECDPGQPEFVQPGCLALTEVTEPVLVPPIFGQKQPLTCYFAGGVNVNPFPNHYVECITKLFNSYLSHHEKSPKSLIVNTMGHSKGIGVQLLLDIFSIVKPTHVIQINRGTSKIWNLPPLTKEFLNDAKGWKNKVPIDAMNYDLLTIDLLALTKQTLYRPAILRQLGFFSYFLQLQTSEVYRPLNSYTPYVVKWCDVALYCCNQIVPNHELLYVFNGSMISLCNCSQFQELPRTDPSLPKFLNEMPDGEWFGYGIVRGIDVEEKLFYIVTPTPKEKLKYVNVLVNSSINLTSNYILHQKTPYPTPYVVKTVLKHRLVGPKALKRRSYLDRLGQNKLIKQNL